MRRRSGSRCPATRWAPLYIISAQAQGAERAVVRGSRERTALTVLQRLIGEEWNGGVRVDVAPHQLKAKVDEARIHGPFEVKRSHTIGLIVRASRRARLTQVMRDVGR